MILLKQAIYRIQGIKTVSIRYNSELEVVQKYLIPRWLNAVEDLMCHLLWFLCFKTVNEFLMKKKSIRFHLDNVETYCCTYLSSKVINELVNVINLYRSLISENYVFYRRNVFLERFTELKEDILLQDKRALKCTLNKILFECIGSSIVAFKCSSPAKMLNLIGFS